MVLNVQCIKMAWYMALTLLSYKLLPTRYSIKLVNAIVVILVATVVVHLAKAVMLVKEVILLLVAIVVNPLKKPNKLLYFI